MSNYRMIKTRWYHQLWDYFFKAGGPFGFEIGWLVCKCYLDGKTGPVFRLPSHLPQRLVDEFDKEERKKFAYLNKAGKEIWK